MPMHHDLLMKLLFCAEYLLVDVEHQAQPTQPYAFLDEDQQRHAATVKRNVARIHYLLSVVESACSHAGQQRAS